MTETLRIGLIQMNSRSDKAQNLAVAERLIAEAAAQGAEVIALPEYVNFLGPRELHEANAEPIPGPTTERFATAAQRYGIYLLGGSILERSDIPGKYFNTSVLFAPTGEILATYRKIHLFDVDLTGNVTSNESATILPGDRIVTAEIAGHTVGLTICYDLRFPNCTDYWHLRGPNSSLSLRHSLFIRGRTTGMPCSAPGPSRISTTLLRQHKSGHTTPGQQCYGHALVADPWGTVIAEAVNRVGVVVTTIDFAYLREVRAQLPSLANRRPEVYGSLALVRS